MKFQIFASVMALAVPATADELTQAFLEQPGVVWVAAQLPATALEGLTVGMIPYIRFSDGRFESGYLSGGVFIVPKSCGDIIECPTLLSEGVSFEGSYTIDDGIVRSDDLSEGDVYFDRPELHRMMVAGDAMIGGVAVLERVGETIVQTRPEGSRTYMPIPEDMRYAAIHVVYDASIPMSEAYHCSIATLWDTLSTPQAELTERDSQIAAYYRLIDQWRKLQNEVTRLDPIGVDITRTTAEEDQLMQARLESQIAGLHRLMISDLQGRAEDVDVAQQQQLTLATMQDVLGSYADLAPDPDALRARFDAVYPDMVLSSSIAVEIRAPRDDGLTGFEAVFCGDNR